MGCRVEDEQERRAELKERSRRVKRKPTPLPRAEASEEFTILDCMAHALFPSRKLDLPNH